MNTLNPYILRAQSELITFSNQEYFYPIVAVITVLVFFIMGRKTYESKFMHILNTINDAEN